ncbi:MAG TPA: hypothetical protein PKB10_02865 [Tepidisphaeraceae bacterium]|nr:hypothetical protein [Tepidisphaeraceae bacterium]
MSSITLQFPDALLEELRRAGQAQDRQPEEIIVDLVERGLLLQRLERVQAMVSGALRADAPTDEDAVLRDLS